MYIFSFIYRFRRQETRTSGFLLASSPVSPVSPVSGLAGEDDDKGQDRPALPVYQYRVHCQLNLVAGAGGGW